MTSKSSTTTEPRGALRAVHPGRILKRELAARDMSANRLALALRLSSGRIVEILNGKRGVSPETALHSAAILAMVHAFGLISRQHMS